MWEKIVNLAISNGLWAVMFLLLLIYLLKDSAKREAKYQETIKGLNQSLGVVNSIKENVDEVKEDVEEIKIEVKELNKPKTRGLKCVDKGAV